MSLIYSGGGGSTSYTDGLIDPGWQPQSYVYGGHIEIPSAGTVTQLGVYAAKYTTPSVAIKLGLYTSAGVLLGQSTQTITDFTAAWLDATGLSISVSAGTHYVLVSGATENARYGYDTAGNGSFATESYSTAMAATESISGQADTGYLYGVRLDFTAGAASVSPSIMRAFPLAILNF